MKDKMIVKGYKGIMDLDLSSFDPKFHEELVLQHNKEIEEYKREQNERPPKLRYENAIVNAMNIIALDRKALEKMRIEKDKLQKQKDEQLHDIFKRIQDQKQHM